MEDEILLNELQEVIVTNLNALPLDIAINDVSTIVFYIFVTLLAVQPFFILFKMLIKFCTELANSKIISQLDGGGFWKRIFKDLDEPMLEKKIGEITSTTFLKKYKK